MNQTPERRPGRRPSRSVLTVLCVLLLVCAFTIGTVSSGTTIILNVEEYEIHDHTVVMEEKPTSAKATTTKKSVPETKAPVVNHFKNLKKGYNKKYCIAVNTAQNVVTVYQKDEEKGTYTVPVKAFICSTGKDGGTRSGTWYTNEKCGQWHALIHNSYGQWCTRIHDGILFHSVPYTAKDPGKLQEGEYNKLGTSASAGCVRMRVKDVKWIYDKCDMGTCVCIYSEKETKEPLGKPKYQKVPEDPEDPRHSWDPTDPDERNPWKVIPTTVTTTTKAPASPSLPTDPTIPSRPFQTVSLVLLKNGKNRSEEPTGVELPKEPASRKSSETFTISNVVVRK